jgi:hypothetical protein
MYQSTTIYVGLDVHKESICISFLAWYVMTYCRLRTFSCIRRKTRLNIRTDHSYV